jgi:dihydroorotate dehydrogenase electron transfer subunit
MDQAITLATLPSIQVTPGQYFRAFAPSYTQVIPIPVYPYAVTPDEFLLCGKLPVDWHPGMDVLMQGPFGNGFSLSLSSRRLLLCAAHLSLEPRLFLLALHALQRAADVVWVSDSLSLALPPQIEILKRSDLPAAMEWSDACAVAVPLHQAGETLNALHIKPADRSKVEVFIDAPLVCGSSRCGVCALETRKGFRLACKDGPIFPLKELQGD